MYNRVSTYVHSYTNVYHSKHTHIWIYIHTFICDLTPISTYIHICILAEDLPAESFGLYIHTNMNIYIHTHMYQYTCVNTCMYTHVNVCTFIHANVNIFGCIHIWVYTHIHVYTHTCIHVSRVYSYMHTCMYTYMSIHTHTHTLICIPAKNLPAKELPAEILGLHIHTHIYVYQPWIPVHISTHTYTYSTRRFRSTPTYTSTPKIMHITKKGAPLRPITKFHVVIADQNAGVEWGYIYVRKHKQIHTVRRHVLNVNMFWFFFLYFNWTPPENHQDAHSAMCNVEANRNAGFKTFGLNVCTFIMCAFSQKITEAKYQGPRCDCKEDCTGRGFPFGRCSSGCCCDAAVFWSGPLRCVT